MMSDLGVSQNVTKISILERITKKVAASFSNARMELIELILPEGPGPWRRTCFVSPDSQVTQPSSFCMKHDEADVREIPG